ncbi:GyrI-like domain-containing protein [Companilactobacillus furfuricola]|uniref:GyrI-like domain-containing protein n=1 Tax=Companilactobacillus furfuricola TaxID=1462575 RepID=UPI000F78E045|nr:GyrI-like domain-containing protein [Companilactobacillus furfuricola]
MKYESRKQEKNLYSTRKKPMIVNVPEQKFFSIHGIGDPNQSGFQERIQTLYPISYGLKFAYKKYCTDRDVEFDDYVVFPLEGVWSLTERGQQMDHLYKNEFEYDVMIRIPDFVPDNVIEQSVEVTRQKKDLPLLDQVEVKTYPAIQAAQICHVGSYDDEPASFDKIDLLVKEAGLMRASKVHREIYLSDARRVEHDKLKTILRYQIK